MRKLSRLFGVAAASMLLSTAAARAAEPGLFLGADLGVAQPTNDNFRQHVQLGMSGEPFVGYQFNKYIGLMTQMHINAWPPDDDNRRFYPPYNIPNETQWTTMWALTAGPRFSLPVFDDLVDLHIGAQGGGYKAMGGRMNQWAPGFQVGGGIDYNLSPNWAVGAFGRWNRAYMSPHPYELLGPEPAPPDQQGPADAQWATAGISVKYTFAEEAVPPPPPPPPPPPAAAPPMKKKIVLRAVNFDFNKYNIRPDAVPILDEAVKVLKAEPESVGVICAGYTDSVGSDAYNMGLSMRRAEAVRDFLVKGGISPKRIKVEGFGESNPVASNATADGRAQNRRTELKLY